MTGLCESEETVRFVISEINCEYFIDSDEKGRKNPVEKEVYYGKSNYGAGYDVQFRQKPSCSRAVQDFQTGRISGSAF